MSLKEEDKINLSNYMKRWNETEINQLLNEISEDINIEQIANIHHRTVGGIKSRLREISFEFYNNNMPLNEIIEKTKLTENEIYDTINRRQSKKDKKEKEDNKFKSRDVDDVLRNLSHEINIIKK
jgi:hypothetical protein